MLVVNFIVDVVVVNNEVITNDSTVPADPEGKMLVSPGCYGIMTKMLLNTGIPVALILEGGYFLESVSSSVEFVIRAMLHETSPHLDEAVSLLFSTL